MRRLWLFAGIIGLVLGIGLTAWFFLRRDADGPTIHSTATVIKEMRSLGRFETASFTLEQIIDAGTTTSSPLQQFLFGDKLLLIAHGEVIAGFDLTALTEEDISVTGTAATIHLPPAQVLVSRLDNSKTRVYDRQTGVFTKGQENLESQAREAAEQAIRTAACEAGILTKAEENIQPYLSASLRLVGIQTVSFITTPGTCI